MANRILAVAGIYLFLVSLAYYLRPEADAAKALFEFLKVGILPLAAVVIYHYFPNRTLQ